MTFYDVNARSASVATISYLTPESDWLLVPHDESGLLLVRYVPKTCANRTGYRSVRDLFSRDGMASVIACTLIRTARRRGLLVHAIEETGCRYLRKAVEDLEAECPEAEPVWR